nr:hypothetical protein Iba_chr05dCG19620 [Ipomoea batatas]
MKRYTEGLNCMPTACERDRQVEGLENQNMAESTPPVCGNAPVTETEVEFTEEVVSKVNEGGVVRMEGDKGNRAENKGSEQAEGEGGSGEVGLMPPGFRELEQRPPLFLSEKNKGGSSGSNKGRRRKKLRGFRVGNALQILALDYGDDEKLDGLERWIEDLKEKVGYDDDLIRAVDEAYEEVLELFEEALEELGQPGMDDELVCKAALIFWKKWERIIQADKDLRESQAASKEGYSVDCVKDDPPVENCEEEFLANGGDSAAVNDGEVADDEFGNHENEYVEDEEEVDEYGECNDENDDRMCIEKDANVEDGEYDEYEFNDDEWLDWLEGKLRYARGVNWMNEVLKEIYSYMQVVYDEQQQVHWEEEGSMALKACIILREVVRVSPMRGCLHPESELGYLLLMNQEIIGRRLCRWAWRRFRRGWEEKLMRLDKTQQQSFWMSRLGAGPWWISATAAAKLIPLTWEGAARGEGACLCVIDIFGPAQHKMKFAEQYEQYAEKLASECVTGA